MAILFLIKILIHLNWKVENLVISQSGHAENPFANVLSFNSQKSCQVIVWPCWKTLWDLQKVFQHDHTVIWKVFWELKVKKSGHAEKLELASNSMKNPSQVIPISYLIIICIYFSSVLYAGSPCLMRISLVNFFTAIFVSGFNVKFWSFFAFEGVLEFDVRRWLDNFSFVLIQRHPYLNTFLFIL